MRACWCTGFRLWHLSWKSSATAPFPPTERGHQAKREFPRHEVNERNCHNVRSSTRTMAMCIELRHRALSIDTLVAFTCSVHPMATTQLTHTRHWFCVLQFSNSVDNLKPGLKGLRGRINITGGESRLAVGAFGFFRFQGLTPAAFLTPHCGQAKC